MKKHFLTYVFEELSGNTINGANNLKVKDYLKYAQCFLPHWDDKYANELLSHFQINKKQQINKLSKGMMSMVTIVVALASKAKYTFLDEPTAGLDVVARNDFISFDRRIHRKRQNLCDLNAHNR